MASFSIFVSSIGFEVSPLDCLDVQVILGFVALELSSDFALLSQSVWAICGFKTNVIVVLTLGLSVLFWNVCSCM